MPQVNGPFSTAPWRVTRGFVLSAAPDLPGKIRDYLRSQGLIARLSWNREHPGQVRLFVATNREGHLCLTSPLQPNTPGSYRIDAGPSAFDVADELATRFGAEVALGQVRINKTTHGEGENGGGRALVWRESPIERSVEILQLSQMALPLMAASEAKPIFALDHSVAARALLIDHASEGQHYYRSFIDYAPVVEALWRENGAGLRFLGGPEAEDWLEHNWGWHYENLYGLAGGDEEAAGKELVDFTRAVVGPEGFVRAVAAVAPGTDEAGLVKALEMDGPEGFLAAARALHLSGEVIDYLRGLRPARDVPTVEVFEPKALAQTMRQSLDLLLSDPVFNKTVVWTTYRKIVRDYPWAIYLLAAAEVIFGYRLARWAWARAGRERGRRRYFLPWALGMFWFFDSAVEIAFANYIRKHIEKR